MHVEACLFFTLFFAGIGVLIAQTQVRGTVVDESGDPVIGATIQIKGTSQGTVSDADGNFNLPAPAGGTLVISYVGYQTQEVPVSANVRVVLSEDAEMLEEVVFTALGLTREKKTLGYGVTSISGDEISQAQTVNPMQALQGKVAGVDISSAPSPGGTQNIAIRGFSSFGNNQPLYVVDGVPITNAQNRSGSDLNSQTDFGSGINALNPNDIDNITVLKGSAASALYGSRVAQGVIMITTKSGRNTNGELLVAYDGGITVQQVGRLPTEQTMFGQGWSGDRALSFFYLVAWRRHT
ncbi:TonB-dependent receptor plug domain-containing protein [uncultured Proteiniphilum sp.]|uniref:TonB-dependent receptor plug domain-containing protein n=1 Tax=uncultured Proteiniphilum sp. TaxID=497637 RepID=UPI00262E778A|nr:TonB-dependent receptor plug domain-containing protein [uncultured Proteiniphilum sp.]